MTTRKRLRYALPGMSSALVLFGCVLFSSSANAQEYSTVLADCWLPAGGSGDRLMLDPGGSFMMAGEVGTWTARPNSITMQSRRDRRDIWDLVLADGGLTLSNQREERRVSGEWVESAAGRDRQLEFQRALFADCGRVPTYPAPEETDPPNLFVPTPPSIVLTNRVRNDPVEIRIVDPYALVLCEILSDTCQPVGPETMFFSESDPALIPTASRGRAAGSFRIWRVVGGDVSRGDLTRVGPEPCLAEDEVACRASQGYVILVLDAADQPVTGWVVLGSSLEPAVDRALLAPSAGDAPPMLWIETARYVRERGEFFWTGFTLGIEEETLRMIAAVGPYSTGAQIVASRTATADGGVEVCSDVMRATPVFDASNGSVQLITEVESRSDSAYQLELVWSTEVNRHQAVTLSPGSPPATEQTCQPE